ncbi:hypothetical protein [Cohnella laeviribosi]|uniref:hypothetical protein n=1 Tax=Cohnella laeviribosi TaxID=380174 RepID=UPI003D21718B
MLRLVMAVPDSQYASKLSRFLRESEPSWRIAAFTQEIALLRHLEEAPGTELLLLHSSFLPAIRAKADAGALRGRIVVLAERPGEGEGLPEVAMYQPMSRLLTELTEHMHGDARKSGEAAGGAPLLTVFSAAGGCGKTALALNIARQTGERGYRVFYLNLEALNATDLLFGTGEADSLSRLLYALRTRPEDRAAEELERLRRSEGRLRAEYFDAPDHPGERLAMTAEQLRELIGALRADGRYDLIVADADSGCGDWHLELLNLSARVVWMVMDDAQSLRKAEKLARYWMGKLPMDAGSVSFVLNKFSGAMKNEWRLPGKGPAGVLPYVPQWKAMAGLEGWFASPAFSGSVDRLLDEWGWPHRFSPELPAEGGGPYASFAAVGRRAR